MTQICIPLYARHDHKGDMHLLVMHEHVVNEICEAIIAYLMLMVTFCI